MPIKFFKYYIYHSRNEVEGLGSAYIAQSLYLVVAMIHASLSSAAFLPVLSHAAQHPYGK
jgi:hypothetical protein